MLLNGTHYYSIVDNGGGRVSSIFILQPHCETNNGFKVGTNFGDILSKFKNADFRYGELNDGEHAGGEMCKAGGMLFVHFVDEDSPNKMADYNYSNKSFSLRGNNYTNTQVDMIIISKYIW